MEVLLSFSDTYFQSLCKNKNIPFTLLQLISAVRQFIRHSSVPKVSHRGIVIETNKETYQRGI